MVQYLYMYITVSCHSKQMVALSRCLFFAANSHAGNNVLISRCICTSMEEGKNKNLDKPLWSCSTGFKRNLVLFEIYTLADKACND